VLKGAGMVICLERGADLHMAQLMPLPLTISCFSKIQTGFTFLVQAHPGSLDKGPLNVCVCVLYRVYTTNIFNSQNVTDLTTLTSNYYFRVCGMCLGPVYKLTHTGVNSCISEVITTFGN